MNITGAITTAALAAEQCFDRIQVYERRESAGGTWYIYTFQNEVLHRG